MTLVQTRAMMEGQRMNESGMYHLDDPNQSSFYMSPGKSSSISEEEIAIAKLLIEAVRRANAGGFDLKVYRTHVVIHRRAE